MYTPYVYTVKRPRASEETKAPTRCVLGCVGASMGLTPALTDTALAAQPEEGNRWNLDIGIMDDLKGCVQGRTLWLGKTIPLFA